MEFVFRELDTNIILGVIAILVFFYLIQRRFKAANGPPKPPESAGGWPLIGHLNLLRGPQFPHIALGALADKYGPVFSMRIGIHPTVVISSWEVAKECYTTNDKAVSSRPYFMAAEILSWNYAMVGFGPYNSYWREIRKITASELLSSSRLEHLKHVRAYELEDSLKELYKLWEKKQIKSLDDSVQVEMKQWMGDINLNVILRMVVGKRYFGSVMEGDEKDVLRCRETFREFFHYIGLFMVSDAIPFLRWLDLGGYEKAMKKTAKEMDCLADEWLNEHRQKRDSRKFNADQQDFMDVMLSVLDGADLAGFDANTVNKATCMNLIAGGTDTTTVTLVWVLSLLLNNPSVLSKVQEELDIQVGKERLADESDISKLVYLQAVVKETLRLYPAGPLSTRELIEDCTIGGYYVPKGTRLITNIWKIQTDPEIWPDPFEFKPERFLTTHKYIDVKGKHFELIPFGGGRRACPGLTFGLQMTHIIIAGLLQAFDLSSNEPVDMIGSFGLTNMKATPLNVLVKPRLPPCVYD